MTYGTGWKEVRSLRQRYWNQRVSRRSRVAARVGPKTGVTPQPREIGIHMANQEKELSAHPNAANSGPSHTRAPDRRRKEVTETHPGVAGEGGPLPGMTKEYSAWDVYNNEARKVDTELVNDWRDSLNSLLLFVGILLPELELTLRFTQAAIFAAVLTAFIIESKKVRACFNPVLEMPDQDARCSNWTQRV